MDIRYERVFSIVDILERNMKKWENVLPYYQNVKKERIVLWKAGENVDSYISIAMKSFSGIKI